MGQRHIPAALQPVGSVNLGAFVKPRVDGGNGRQVKDASPAEALPDAGDRIKDRKRFRQGVIGFGRYIEKGQKLVQYAVGIQKRKNHAGHNYAGDEIGHIAGRLQEFFEEIILQLIDQQGKQDRAQKAECQV